MAQAIYKYEKLADATKDIRLITLLAGQTDNHIKFRISHGPFETSTRSSRAGHRLEDARETSPDGWEAFEALGGRILFDIPLEVLREMSNSADDMGEVLIEGLP
jgi:hypothetical protein